MNREFKSKVDWWYYLALLLLVAACVTSVLRTNIAAIVGTMLATALAVHIFLDTKYCITADGMLIAHCSIFPEKKIAIADIEALEASIMPVSSYALSLDRIVVWTNGSQWMLVSPENKSEFVQLLRKINPRIQIIS